MIFKDREDAGRRLGARLAEYAGRKDVTVLGIPRGGVPVAYEVARALGAPLDLFLSHKLGVPGQEELAFGAVAAGDGRFLDAGTIRSEGVTEEQIERITAEVRALLERRAVQYRGERGALAVEGRTVILVDDGIATGASVYAAVQALRQMRPARIVVAVPVAPGSTCAWLRRAAEEVVSLHTPERFFAVGQFYEDFRQVEDDEVVELLGGQGSGNRE